MGERAAEPIDALDFHNTSRQKDLLPKYSFDLAPFWKFFSSYDFQLPS